MQSQSLRTISDDGRLGQTVYETPTARAKDTNDARTGGYVDFPAQDRSKATVELNSGHHWIMDEQGMLRRVSSVQESAISISNNSSAEIPQTEKPGTTGTSAGRLTGAQQEQLRQAMEQLRSHPDHWLAQAYAQNAWMSAQLANRMAPQSLDDGPHLAGAVKSGYSGQQVSVMAGHYEMSVPEAPEYDYSKLASSHQDARNDSMFGG